MTNAILWVLAIMWHTKYQFLDRLLLSSWCNWTSNPYNYVYYPFVTINNDEKFVKVHQTVNQRCLIYHTGHGVIDGFNGQEAMNDDMKKLPKIRQPY